MGRGKRRPAGQKRAEITRKREQTDTRVILGCDADGNDIVLTAHNPAEPTEWIIEGLLARGGILEVSIYDL
jgi:hypothetical protein